MVAGRRLHDHRGRVAGDRHRQTPRSKLAAKPVSKQASKPTSKWVPKLDGRSTCTLPRFAAMNVGDLGGLRRIAIVNRGEPAMRLIHAVRRTCGSPPASICGRSPCTPPPSGPRCSFVKPTRPSACDSEWSRWAEESISRSRHAGDGTGRVEGRRRLGGVGIRRRAPGVRRALRPTRDRLRRSSTGCDAQPRRQDRCQAARRAG